MSESAARLCKKNAYMQVRMTAMTPEFPLYTARLVSSPSSLLAHASTFLAKSGRRTFRNISCKFHAWNIKSLFTQLGVSL